MVIQIVTPVTLGDISLAFGAILAFSAALATYFGKVINAKKKYRTEIEEIQDMNGIGYLLLQGAYIIIFFFGLYLFHYLGHQSPKLLNNGLLLLAIQGVIIYAICFLRIGYKFIQKIDWTFIALDAITKITSIITIYYLIQKEFNFLFLVGAIAMTFVSLEYFATVIGEHHYGNKRLVNVGKYKSAELVSIDSEWIIIKKKESEKLIFINRNTVKTIEDT